VPVIQAYVPAFTVHGVDRSLPNLAGLCYICYEEKRARAKDLATQIVARQYSDVLDYRIVDIYGHERLAFNVRAGKEKWTERCRAAEHARQAQIGEACANEIFTRVNDLLMTYPCERDQAFAEGKPHATYAEPYATYALFDERDRTLPAAAPEATAMDRAVS
jgi:hypothetical protein